MNLKISSNQFKQIISGRATPNHVFTDYSQKLINQLEIEYAENQIIVKGTFEFSDDLIFYEGEEYKYEIYFDGGNYKNIIFRGGNFKKILFRRGEYNGYVSIRGGNFDKLILLGGNFNHWLGTIDGILNLEHGDRMLAEEPLTINRFEIEGGFYKNNMWISGGDINSLEIKCVTPVIIHCKPNDDKILDSERNILVDKFNSKPRINNLLISRYSNKNTFYHFNELDIENLKFENFTNLGNITMSKISLSQNLSIENSDLGKTSFIDCDFSDRKLIFDSSKINEIALAGVKLPKPKDIDSLVSGDKHQKKLALSQIKKVYQNLGDNISASIYLSEELNTLKSTLKPGWEKFNLWLNKHTNNHGQRWDRPLALLLLSTLFFYTLYCLSLGYQIDFETSDFTILKKNASYFFEFLNPIRKTDFLPKALLGVESIEVISGKTILIDSLAKILNAYLLYQFVAAFRKFGRTGK